MGLIPIELDRREDDEVERYRKRRIKELEWFIGDCESYFSGVRGERGIVRRFIDWLFRRGGR